MVPVLIDQALDVALEKAAALEPLVEKGRVRCITLRKSGIDDLDPAAQLDTQRASAFAHAVLAPDEQRRPKSVVNEARRGADDLLFFAFGEHDPLRTSPQPLVNALENPGYRVAPRAQLRPVSIHIDDRSPGHAAVHGGSADGGAREPDQPRVDPDPEDVHRPAIWPVARG